MYDTPNSLACIAPRPLLIINGELDPRCPMGGVHVALESARAAYEAAGAADQLQLHVEPGVGHKRTDDMDVVKRAWFDQHLMRGTRRDS